MPSGPVCRAASAAVATTSVGPVATLTLGRPGSHPTLADAVVEGLHAGLDSAEADPSCRVVVLRGGDGVFCTGMDLEEAAADAPGEARRQAERFYDLMVRFTETGLTVVAVVDGRATGGGVGLVAACDFAFATPRTQLSLPEALWGLLPCCVLPFVVRRTGFRPAYALALGTMPLGAAEAAAVGLVDEVADDPEVPLRRLVARVSRIAPSTVRSLKAYADRLAPVPLSPAVRRHAVDTITRLTSAPDFAASVERYASRGLYPWEPDPPAIPRR